MASSPIKHARFAILHDLGIDEVIDLYIEYGTVRELVRHIFTARHAGETPSVRFLYDWLQDDPERWAQWQQAKRIIGTLEADAAIVAARDATPKDVQVRRLQAEVHKWRASVMNREEFGERPQKLDVAISLKSEWAEAMRVVGEELRAERLLKAEIVKDEPPALPAATDES